MFDIGFGELLLIGLVALLVLGPERLPGAARTAGAMLRKIRESWNGVRDEVERELEAEELRKNLREAQEHIRSTSQSVRESVNDGTESVREVADVMTGKALPSRDRDAAGGDDATDPAHAASADADVGPASAHGKPREQGSDER